MRKWQAYSVLALVCGAVGVACGASSSSGTSEDASSAAVSAASVPSDNTANLDSVMSSSVTQSYLAAASKNRKCAADANAVMQIVQTLTQALGDANGTIGVGAGASNGNIATAADTNSAVVIGVFEQDLPALQTALAALQQCVHANCGDGNMPSIPTFPCGKPGSSTFPNHHAGNGNATDANSACDGDSHHHTTGGTTTAGTTTAGTTTAGTTTAGTTTAGTTTGVVTTTTGGASGTSTGGTPGSGTTTAGTTTGSATTGGVVTEPNTVTPGNNEVASNCISVVLGGRAFVGCGVSGL